MSPMVAIIVITFSDVVHVIVLAVTVQILFMIAVLAVNGSVVAHGRSSSCKRFGCRLWLL